MSRSPIFLLLVLPFLSACTREDEPPSNPGQLQELEVPPEAYARELERWITGRPDFS